MKRMPVYLAALALVLCAGSAGAVGIGVGAFGGVGIPIVQDDNGKGSVFGVRVPVSLLPLVTVEPYYLKGSGGDKDQEVGNTTITREGIDVSGFGANVMLTFGGGLQLYPYAGIGSYSLERTGLDTSNTAYNFGLGLAIKPPIAKLSVHLRGELNAVLEEGDSDSSRKWANVTVGVSYGLFDFPPTP